MPWAQELKGQAQGKDIFNDYEWVNAVRLPLACARPFFLRGRGLYVVEVCSLPGRAGPRGKAAQLHIMLYLIHTRPAPQPFGTEKNPVVVTSAFASRIVGATDVDDDSIIHWVRATARVPQVASPGQSCAGADSILCHTRAWWRRTKRL